MLTRCYSYERVKYDQRDDPAQYELKIPPFDLILIDKDM